MQVDGRATMTINNSSAKQQFSFAKADRFLTPKQQTKAFAHIYPNYFQTPISQGKGDGFNTSESRFLKPRCSTTMSIDGPGTVVTMFVTGGFYNDPGNLVSAGFYNTTTWEQTWDGGVAIDNFN